MFFKKIKIFGTCHYLPWKGNFENRRGIPPVKLLLIIEGKGMEFHPFMAKLVDDDIVNQGKGKLYSLGIKDDIIGFGAAAPALFHLLELQLLISQADLPGELLYPWGYLFNGSFSVPIIQCSLNSGLYFQIRIYMNAKFRLIEFNLSKENISCL